MDKKDLEALKIETLIKQYPYASEFFEINSLPLETSSVTITEYIEGLPIVFLEDIGVNRKNLLKRFHAFMEKMAAIKDDWFHRIHELTIIGGSDKNGKPEAMDISIVKGDIVCIVGPTGSGKSRLLADIEWMAQADTPTHRMIHINGEAPPKAWRFSVEHKLVAQLSQNMNFVMDISVGDFIALHAQSRMVDDVEGKIEEIITHANDLSGEAFDLTTPLTALSGGQSRALMVADTAFLSRSPIVLIDEIENAGIHRQKAMALLVGQNKIVFIATHDPLLALMGNKRMVIKNGGIQHIIETTQKEKKTLAQLIEMDAVFSEYRLRLRNGDLLE